MSSCNLVFHTVSMRNFMSYGNVTTTINLNQKGTIQIHGRNLDNMQQGVGANGVGKTTIINAIVYALYGELLGSDVKIDDVVNDINNKECVVSIVFELDGDRYKISRYRKMKSGPEGNYIEIFKNDLTGPDNNLAKATIPETNKWIESQLLDMPKGLFTRLVVYDADEKSFFKLSAAEQRELMESLFQLTILSEKADVIKEQQKQTKSVLDIEEVAVEAYKSQIDNYKRQIERAKARIDEWEANRKEELDSYRSDFLQLDAIDIEQQHQLLRQIDETQREIDIIEQTIEAHIQQQKQHEQAANALSEKIKLQIENITSQFTIKRQQLLSQEMTIKHQIEDEQQAIQLHKQQINTIIEQQNQCKQQIDRILKKIKLKMDDIEQHRKQIETLNNNECPECHQQMPDASVNIQKRQVAIADSEKLIDEFKQEIDGLLTEQDALSVTQKEYELKHDDMLQQSVIDELQSQINEIRVNLKNIDNEKKGIVSDCETHNHDEMQQLRDLINESQNQIKSLREKQQLLKTTLHPKELLVKHEKQLIQLESEKESIRKRIEDLDGIINPHLDTMNELIEDEPEAMDFTQLNHYKIMIDHQQFLIKVLTDKKSFIRKKLISKRLPYLNERLAVYLKAMGLPYKVEFNSDLSPSISKRGKEKSFGALSHGQKARVNFALSFAFRDILERMHRKINICLLDEVLDKALCPVGANSAVTLINEKAREDKITIFVITHRNDLATRFHKQLIVTLENGFSSVEYQTGEIQLEP